MAADIGDERQRMDDVPQRRGADNEHRAHRTTPALAPGAAALGDPFPERDRVRRRGGSVDVRKETT
jgi:hypothetical protein